MRSLGRILWGGRRWIVAATILFFMGIGLGLVMAQSEPELLIAQLRPVMERIGGIGERVIGSDSPVERSWIIYRNNAQAVTFMMLGGLIFFGMIPALGLFGNGLIAGIVIGLAGRISPQAADPWTLFLSLAPHGVIELPAIWIGGAWAMKLGLSWVVPGAVGQRWEIFKGTLREAVIVLALVMVMLLVAAVIEGNVTLALVHGTRSA